MKQFLYKCFFWLQSKHFFLVTWFFYSSDSVKAYDCVHMMSMFMTSECEFEVLAVAINRFMINVICETIFVQIFFLIAVKTFFSCDLIFLFIKFSRNVWLCLYDINIHNVEMLIWSSCSNSKQIYDRYDLWDDSLRLCRLIISEIFIDLLI